MKRPEIEPGLLAVFQLFLGLRLGLLLLGSVVALARILIVGLPDDPSAALRTGFDERLLYFVLFDLFGTGMLLIYLWWPPVQRRLGAYFLPLALFVAAIVPIIEHNIRLANQVYQPGPDLLVGAWQLVVVLTIPLILAAWQYDFRVMLLFSLGTLFFDAGLTFIALGGSDNPDWLPTMGVMFSRTILYLLMGFIVVRLMKVQRRQRHSLTEANAQLRHHAATLEQLTISQERNRLARELHDTLAHTLSGLIVQLEALDAALETNPDTAAALLHNSLTTARSGLTETRRAMQDLRAGTLNDLGLALAVKNLAQTVSQRAGMSLDLQAPENIDPLDPLVEQNIYRIAQQALANIDQHSGATHMQLQLAAAAGNIQLKIKDNGIGFAESAAASDGHFGLKNMQERAEMIGGKLEIKSAPGEGTSIYLSVNV